MNKLNKKQVKQTLLTKMYLDVCKCINCGGDLEVLNNNFICKSCGAVYNSENKR